MLDDLDRLMEIAGIDAIVAEGSAFEVPDIFWMTGFRSTDSIICLKSRNEPQVIAAGFNTLDRIRSQSFVKRTHDLTELYVSLMRENKRAQENPEIIYRDVLKNLFTGKVLGVPDHIPARVLVAIQKLGYDVRVMPDLLKEARARKSDAEIKTIRKAGDATIESMTEAFQMIRDSKVGPNRTLIHKGQPLTVGDFKLKLELALVTRSAESAEDAIVDVGKKGFDYHYLGAPRDVMKAGEPIIIDVFPRLKLDRYVADITRTVIKGPMSDRVKTMYDAVAEAKAAAVDTLTDGAVIDDVNMACFKSLKARGFDSRRLNPTATEGMTHGLGHGIGLEVHENPNMYHYTEKFSEGHVITIEPGVYFKSVGGVRLEDDYLVTKGKAKLLTRGLDDVMSL